MYRKWIARKKNGYGIAEKLPLIEKYWCDNNLGRSDVLG
jgi:hypothetical protein